MDSLRGQRVVAAAKVHDDAGDVVLGHGEDHVVVGVDEDLVMVDVASDQHVIARAVARDGEHARVEARGDGEEATRF